MAATFVFGVLAVAAPARAQQPVQGGGSFNDAPVVAAGSYRDTIRPTEKLFYAIEVAEGQRLRAAAIISGTGGQGFGAFNPGRLTLYNPIRADLDFDSELIDGGRTQHSLNLEGETVGDAETGYEQPGVYFAAVSLDPGNLDDQEYGVTLTLTLLGQAVSPGPTAAPTPAPSPPATAPPASPEAAVPPERDGGGNLGGLVLVGVISFVVGGLAGAVGVLARHATMSKA